MGNRSRNYLYYNYNSRQLKYNLNQKYERDLFSHTLIKLIQKYPHLKIIKEYFRFIINPKKLNKSKIDKKEIVICFLFFVISYLIISFFFSYLISFFAIQINFNSHVKKVLNGNVLFLVMIIAPVSEELLFRAILRPSKINFSLFCFSILFFLFQFLEISFYLSVIVSISSAVIIYLVGININSFIHNNFINIIYISVVIFASLHIFSFKLTYSLLVALPLLMLPKIYLAFALSFSRVKYGLFSCIFLHSIINGMSIYLGTF